MSNTSQQQKTSTRTKNISDSYNTTETVNRIFDSSGNTSLYINSDDGKSAAESGGMSTNLLIAGGVIAAAIILSKD
jgi:hypothetical protein